STYGSGKTHALVALASGIRYQGRIAAAADSGEMLQLAENIPSLSVLPTLIASTGRVWHLEKGLADLLTRIPIQELADRAWELLPKRTGGEELQTFLAALRQHLGTIDLATLKDIADVFSGISYRSADLVRIKGDAKSS